MEIKVNRKLYAIRAADGRWFRRARGYGRSHWAEDFLDANVWPKISIPRAIISRYHNDPYYRNPTPTLVEINVDKVNTIEEPERLEKARGEFNKKRARKKEQTRQYFLRIASGQPTVTGPSALEIQRAKENLERLEAGTFYPEQYEPVG